MFMILEEMMQTVTRKLRERLDDHVRNGRRHLSDVNFKQ
jgi:hypothetical protein